jgi:hypothetical protein
VSDLERPQNQTADAVDNFVEKVRRWAENPHGNWVRPEGSTFCPEMMPNENKQLWRLQRRCRKIPRVAEARQAPGRFCE